MKYILLCLCFIIITPAWADLCPDGEYFDERLNTCLELSPDCPEGQIYDEWIGVCVNQGDTEDAPDNSGSLAIRSAPL